jgi:hypothetical protein
MTNRRTDMDPRLECSNMLYAAAREEKNIRTKRYLMDQAREIAQSRDDEDILTILKNLAVDAQRRLDLAQVGHGTVYMQVES